MSWTSPRTFVANEYLTAALLNTHLRDNLSFLGSSHAHAGAAGDGATIIPAVTGMIAIFDATCPTGWTRVSAFDNLFLRGSATYGTSAGADAHTHTGPSHTHTGPSHTHTGPSHTHTGPSHTHTGPSHTHDSNWEAGTNDAGSNIGASAASGAYVYVRGAGGGTTGLLKTGVAAAGTGATGADGTGASGASGTAATGADGTGATGADGTGASGSTSNIPAHITVIFCKRN